MKSGGTGPVILGRPDVLALAQAALVAYAKQPADPLCLENLFETRRLAATTLAKLNPSRKDGPGVEAAFSLLQDFWQSGVTDQPARSEDLALAREYRGENWPGLLAAMLLVPAWQWPDAPRLEDVPVWLWAKFTAYVFQTPQGFVASGQAQVYADHYLRRLEELAAVAGKNRGSGAVRDALTIFCSANNCIPLYFNGDSLLRHYQLRARILTLAFVTEPAEEMLPLPRLGRRLRVGFINRHFGSQTETYTTIPSFEQLDPERFEVLLYAHHSTDSALEQYVRSRVAGFAVLPADTADQVSLLRGEALDVVVFGTNLTAVCNEVVKLALHRVAPLQIANNSSCTKQSNSNLLFACLDQNSRYRCAFFFLQ